MKLDFPDSLKKEFPEFFPVASKTCVDVAASVRNTDLCSLARRSPGLAGFDWSSYLHLSSIRMVRACRALAAAGALQGRLLDLGAYFGNFALMFARLGFEVDAIDSYTTYAPAFDPVIALLRREGVHVLDLESCGVDMAESPSAIYDVVTCMGVIEHIPHTPRRLLEAINRVLKPDGILVLDTPNLGYVYRRQALSRGETIFCPIELQYDTEIPFEGHHREYTRREVQWLLRRIGHEVVFEEMFNFSVYSLQDVQGLDLENYKASERDPELREIILTASRKLDGTRRST